MNRQRRRSAAVCFGIVQVALLLLASVAAARKPREPRLQHVQRSVAKCAPIGERRGHASDGVDADWSASAEFALHGVDPREHKSLHLTDALELAPYLQRASSRSMTVCWRTWGLSATRLLLWTSATTTATMSPSSQHAPGRLCEHRMVTDSGAASHAHAVHLQDLQPATTYYYAVGSNSTWQGYGRSLNFTTWPLSTRACKLNRTQPLLQAQPAAEPHQQHVQPCELHDAANNERLFRLWVLGDSGSGTRPQLQVRDAFLAYCAASERAGWDATLLLGDNAYPEGTAADYKRTFFEPYKEVLASVPAFLTLGNHELRSSDAMHKTGAYFKYFLHPFHAESEGLASRTPLYYSFTIANAVHVVSIDTEITVATAANVDAHGNARNPIAVNFLEWLQEDLRTAEARFTVIFTHRPVYSKGWYDSDTDKKTSVFRARVVPMLEKFGVDLVLSGHSHAYERSHLIGGHYSTSKKLKSSMVHSTNNTMHKGDCARDGTVYVVAGVSSGSTLHRDAFRRTSHGHKRGGTPTTHPVMARSIAAVGGSLVVEVRGDELQMKFLSLDGVVEDSIAIRKERGACLHNQRLHK
mmetsp:Transcript_439/g.1539  ORF Transcript_439/g.1539 Transcript_439/m.1539 type:complete len:582 (-) Transcript_439:84-1829(-)